MRTAQTSSQPHQQPMDPQTSAAVRRGVAEVLRQARIKTPTENDADLPPNLRRLLDELTKYD